MSYQELKNQPDTGSKVLKDLDYIRLKEIKKFLKLTPNVLSHITQKLTVDVSFLKSLGFMDYSLLFAIKKVDEESQSSS